MMTITVIIVNWKSGEWLAECLRRFGAQTIQPARVLVVDNASSDGSMTRAGKFANVTVLCMNANLGSSAMWFT
jgi:GT2 family glycosyltransferase